MIAPSLLFVDAYDSFSNNIIALLRQTSGNNVSVIQIDTNITAKYGCSLYEFLQQFTAIVLGPGPGNPNYPEDVGLFNEVWQAAQDLSVPVLGICLGFQSLCLQYGVPVEKMQQPCHGQVKSIQTTGLDIFKNLITIKAVNYNSLAVRSAHIYGTSLGHDRNVSRESSTTTSRSSSSSRGSDASRSPVLEALAWDQDGYLMAVRHCSQPFWGVQFHPESARSDESCQIMMQQWYRAVQKHNKLRPRLFNSTQVSKKNVEKCGSRSESSNSALSQLLRSFRDKYSDQVGWQSFQFDNLNITEQIADLCYRSNGTGSQIMLESTAKGRYSIYSFHSTSAFGLIYHKEMLRISKDNAKLLATIRVEPIEAMRQLSDCVQKFVAEGGSEQLPFWGGLIGYISYEMGLKILSHRTNTDLHLEQSVVPDFEFHLVDRSVVVDHIGKTAYIQSIRKADDAWLDNMSVTLKALDGLDSHVLEFERPKIIKTQRPERHKYFDAIELCQKRLRAGNSYELCLTTEAQVSCEDKANSTYSLYRSLNAHNPVPFAALLNFADSEGSGDARIAIMSTSPEQFLSQDRIGHLNMMPMKGTVKRTPSMSIDKARQILSTAKESAENLMIADLIRHDLYAVSELSHHNFDPVSVVKLNEVTEYQTVYQLTSHIRATPCPNMTSSHDKLAKARQLVERNVDALLCTMPPGSMTGAPKLSSCSILQDLEKRSRGIYSGVVGFFDVGGGTSWSVAIRTAFSGPQDTQLHAGEPTRTWHIGAGGAVTILSDTEAEWDEMKTKMNSVLHGFGVV